MTLKVSDFSFELPNELIARTPAIQRQGSRLLQFTGNPQDCNHGLIDRNFPEIIDLIPENSVLVYNNTRVIPARCFGCRITGAKVEILFERLLPNQCFLAHVRANRSLKPGQIAIVGEDQIGASPLNQAEQERLATLAQTLYQLEFADENTPADQVTLLQVRDEIEEILRDDNSVAFMCIGREENLFVFHCLNRTGVFDLFHRVGHIPLPPYMEREDNTSDQERYQTVYAKVPGAVAAPTAGLHFTPEIINQIKEKGVEILEITLHVGAGTFLPVKVENLQDHQMHAEWLEVSPQVTECLNKALVTGRKIVCVGTTSVRSLETVAQYSLQKYLEQVKTQPLNHTLCEHAEYATLHGIYLQYLQSELHPAAQELFATWEQLTQVDLTELRKLRSLPDFHAKQQELEQAQAHARYQDCWFTHNYLNTELQFGTQIPLLPYTGNTEIFIHPGHKVHLVDYLITNFHLPESTLIMLVSAFIGRDYTLNGYQHAISSGYRFYSYGDSSFVPNLRETNALKFIIK